MGSDPDVASASASHTAPHSRNPNQNEWQRRPWRQEATAPLYHRSALAGISVNQDVNLYSQPPVPVGRGKMVLADTEGCIFQGGDTAPLGGVESEKGTLMEEGKFRTDETRGGDLSMRSKTELAT
jgi:hypothetical protein